MNTSHEMNHIDYISEGIIIIDDMFNIVSTNHVFNVWFKGEDRDFKNRNLFDRFPELREKKFLTRLEKIFKFNAPVVLSSLIHKRFVDIHVGSERLMIQETLINTINIEGRRQGIICIKDVTEHCESLKVVKKRSEDNQKLVTKKLNFLSTISHDLRTPLNGIIGSLDLLKHSELNKDQGEIIETINTCSYYLLNLINDFLDISKIESNKFKIEKHNVNVERFVCEIKEMFNPEFERKKIKFVIHNMTNLDLTIFADDMRLKQVLVNLISNSLKFTSRGKVILTIEIENGELLFSVKDTGQGIPEKDQAGIFDTFSQVNRMHRGSSEGSGLGLSIVKSIIEMMSGTINLESKFGVGTHIRFVIPVEEVTPDTKMDSQHDSSNRTLPEHVSNLRVLVAEDNIINKKILKKFLEKLKIHTVLVDNGKEALDKFKEEEFDIVFLDYQMPVMNGVEAATQMIKLKPHNCPVLVAVSANALTEDRHLFQKTGFDHILSKPYTFDEFSTLVNKIIELSIGKSVQPILEKL
ncbi:hypothetical protein A9Q84_15105 [Halobacteriovorax marinus]|uniref:histidine kinase n=1 Tax=Halobacteriovorax marinus TaxID=97084 RepID=A0A1Y5FBP1_9BACT|nr:hypothetical protein A9Q84_15105 [Halobacteriovorax marinus]